MLKNKSKYRDEEMVNKNQRAILRFKLWNLFHIFTTFFIALTKETTCKTVAIHIRGRRKGNYHRKNSHKVSELMKNVRESARFR